MVPFAGGLASPACLANRHLLGEAILIWTGTRDVSSVVLHPRFCVARVGELTAGFCSSGNRAAGLA